MSNRIKHSGIVEEIRVDGLKVRILQTSACAGCKISGHCNASESKEKTVDVAGNNRHGKYAVGDKVTVTMAPHAGMEAVILAFVVPFMILVATVVAVSLVMGNEAVAAVSGICALTPYYILLYLLRDKIKRNFVFTIDER